MASTAQPIDIKKCDFIVKDGDSNSLTIRIGEGMFTYTEKTNNKYVLNRGKLDTVMLGDEVPMEISMEASFINFKSTGSEPVTIREAIKGTASGWVSTDSDPCAPYACDLEIDYKPSCPTIKKENIVFTDFRADDISVDVKTGLIKITGKCNSQVPTSSRVTNTT